MSANVLDSKLIKFKEQTHQHLESLITQFSGKGGFDNLHSDTSHMFSSLRKLLCDPKCDFNSVAKVQMNLGILLFNRNKFKEAIYFFSNSHSLFLLSGDDMRSYTSAQTVVKCRNAIARCLASSPTSAVSAYISMIDSAHLYFSTYSNHYTSYVSRLEKFDHISESEESHVLYNKVNSSAIRMLFFASELARGYYRLSLAQQECINQGLDIGDITESPVLVFPSGINSIDDQGMYISPDITTITTLQNLSTQTLWMSAKLYMFIITHPVLLHSLTLTSFKQQHENFSAILSYQYRDLELPCLANSSSYYLLDSTDSEPSPAMTACLLSLAHDSSNITTILSLYYHCKDALGIISSILSGRGYHIPAATTLQTLLVASSQIVSNDFPHVLSSLVYLTPLECSEHSLLFSYASHSAHYALSLCKIFSKIGDVKSMRYYLYLAYYFFVLNGTIDHSYLYESIEQNPTYTSSVSFPDQFGSSDSLLLSLRHLSSVVYTSIASTPSLNDPNQTTVWPVDPSIKSSFLLHEWLIQACRLESLLDPSSTSTSLSSSNCDYSTSVTNTLLTLYLAMEKEAGDKQLSGLECMLNSDILLAICDSSLISSRFLGINDINISNIILYNKLAISGYFRLIRSYETNHRKPISDPIIQSKKDSIDKSSKSTRNYRIEHMERLLGNSTFTVHSDRVSTDKKTKSKSSKKSEKESQLTDDVLSSLFSSTVTIQHSNSYIDSVLAVSNDNTTYTGPTWGIGCSSLDPSSGFKLEVETEEGDDGVDGVIHISLDRGNETVWGNKDTTGFLILITAYEYVQLSQLTMSKIYIKLGLCKHACTYALQSLDIACITGNGYIYSLCYLTMSHLEILRRRMSVAYAYLTLATHSLLRSFKADSDVSDQSNDSIVTDLGVMFTSLIQYTQSASSTNLNISEFPSLSLLPSSLSLPLDLIPYSLTLICLLNHVLHSEDITTNMNNSASNSKAEKELILQEKFIQMQNSFHSCYDVLLNESNESSKGVCVLDSETDVVDANDGDPDSLMYTISNAYKANKMESLIKSNLISSMNEVGSTVQELDGTADGAAFNNINSTNFTLLLSKLSDHLTDSSSMSSLMLSISAAINSIDKLQKHQSTTWFPLLPLLFSQKLIISEKKAMLHVSPLINDYYQGRNKDLTSYFGNSINVLLLSRHFSVSAPPKPKGRGRKKAVTSTPETIDSADSQHLLSLLRTTQFDTACLTVSDVIANSVKLENPKSVSEGKKTRSSFSSLLLNVTSVLMNDSFPASSTSSGSTGHNLSSLARWWNVLYSQYTRPLLESIDPLNIHFNTPSSTLSLGFLNESLSSISEYLIHDSNHCKCDGEYSNFDVCLWTTALISTSKYYSDLASRMTPDTVELRDALYLFASLFLTSTNHVKDMIESRVFDIIQFMNIKSLDSDKKTFSKLLYDNIVGCIHSASVGVTQRVESMIVLNGQLTEMEKNTLQTQKLISACDAKIATDSKSEQYITLKKRHEDRLEFYNISTSLLKLKLNDLQLKKCIWKEIEHFLGLNSVFCEYIFIGDSNDSLLTDNFRKSLEEPNSKIKSSRNPHNPITPHSSTFESLFTGVGLFTWLPQWLNTVTMTISLDRSTLHITKFFDYVQYNPYKLSDDDDSIGPDQNTSGLRSVLVLNLPLSCIDSIIPVSHHMICHSSSLSSPAYVNPLKPISEGKQKTINIHNSWDDICSSLRLILQCNTVSQALSRVTTPDTQQQWWNQRFILERALASLSIHTERVVFGAYSGILRGQSCLYNHAYVRGTIEPEFVSKVCSKPNAKLLSYDKCIYCGLNEDCECYGSYLPGSLIHLVKLARNVNSQVYQDDSKTSHIHNYWKNTLISPHSLVSHLSTVLTTVLTSPLYKHSDPLFTSNSSADPYTPVIPLDFNVSGGAGPGWSGVIGVLAYCCGLVTSPHNTLTQVAHSLIRVCFSSIGDNNQQIDRNTCKNHDSESEEEVVVVRTTRSSRRTRATVNADEDSVSKVTTRRSTRSTRSTAPTTTLDESPISSKNKSVKSQSHSVIGNSFEKQQTSDTSDLDDLLSALDLSESPEPNNPDSSLDSTRSSLVDNGASLHLETLSEPCFNYTIAHGYYTSSPSSLNEDNLFVDYTPQSFMALLKRKTSFSLNGNMYNEVHPLSTLFLLMLSTLGNIVKYLHSKNRTCKNSTACITGPTAHTPLTLFLDKSLIGFPFESLPVVNRICLLKHVPVVHEGVSIVNTTMIHFSSILNTNTQKITRHISTNHLLTMCHYLTISQGKKYHTYNNAAYSFMGGDISKSFYTLDPGNDLSRTVTRLQPVFSSPELKDWRGITGSQYSFTDMSTLLSRSNVYVYCGHGGGEQYISSSDINKCTVKGVVMLMGCGSAALKNPNYGSLFEPSGVALAYLHSGALSVTGNLWSVTDKDTDDVSKSIISHIAKLDSYYDSATESSRTKYEQSIQQTSFTDTNVCSHSLLGENIAISPNNVYTCDLASVVNNSRYSTRLFYMNGAALISYGVPLRLHKLPRK